jgi:hypothetical protein
MSGVRIPPLRPFFYRTCEGLFQHVPVAQLDRALLTPYDLPFLKFFEFLACFEP